MMGVGPGENPNSIRTARAVQAFQKPRHVIARVARIAMTLLFVCAGAASASAQPVPTTLQDFFLNGTQPETLTDPLLASTDDCIACHSGYNENLAPYELWQTSAMAQAMRDPIFHAALAIAEQDAAFVGDLCLRCHSPIGWLEGRSIPTDGSGLREGDYDGVSCHVCHRMVDPVFDAAENPPDDVPILNALLIDPNNDIPLDAHSGQYVIDPLDRRRGPFDMVPFFGMHEWRRSPYHQESAMCGTCHDVSNPAFERVGAPIPAPTDTYALSVDDAPNPSQDKYDQFPVERTFSEWSQSDFALAPIEMGGRFGGNKTAVATCQDCHMPDASGVACSIPSQAIDRDDMPLHQFLGGATWIFDAILNLDVTQELWGPGELSALLPNQVAAAQARNIAFLQAASDMELTITGETLTVRIINQTGHKLPTGYPEGRRIWVNVRFYDGSGLLLGEHGAYDDATATLTTEDTKVYETKIGVDATVSAATGVPIGPSFHFALNNVRYKDNRIPPRGFTNAGFASVQADPVDYSYADGQYWDDTDFAMPCDVMSAEVTLYYQTSAKEYIEFLRDENTTNTAGDVLHAQWVATGMSAPIIMDQATLVYGDCNGNARRDTCDIADMTEQDDNGNAIPDACETPTVAAQGGRYITVTPNDPGQSLEFALVLTSPDFPCLEKYLDATGALVDTPTYQTVANWGTIGIGQAEIVPGTQYDVQVEYNGGVRSNIASATTWLWGDVDQNDLVNFTDINLVVQGFQGDFSQASLEAVDLHPCTPNGLINFQDINADVRAFQGAPYTETNCPLPCP